MLSGRARGGIADSASAPIPGWLVETCNVLRNELGLTNVESPVRWFYRSQTCRLGRWRERIVTGARGAADSAAAMAENEDDSGVKKWRGVSRWRGAEIKLEQAAADGDEAEQEVFDREELHRHCDEGNEVAATHGTIDFVLDRDNDAPARFVVVSSRADAQSICKVMTDAWRLVRPSVILSVTGAAGSLALGTQLEDAYVQGLANAASSTRSWIITGGSDQGVMALTGKVMSSLGTGTPCIGIASFGAVMYKEKLVTCPESTFNARGVIKGAGLKVKYWKQDKANNNTAIDANHTHFVLVDNAQKKSFGGEVEMRANIEEHMAREAGGSKGEVPLVCLCVGGGPGTFDTLLEQLKMQNMVLLLAESGGAADAITRFIEAYHEELEHRTPAATDQDLIDLYAVALPAQAAPSPQPALTPPNPDPHLALTLNPALVAASTNLPPTSSSARTNERKSIARPSQMPPGRSRPSLAFSSPLRWRSHRASTSTDRRTDRLTRCVPSSPAHASG